MRRPEPCSRFAPLSASQAERGAVRLARQIFPLVYLAPVGFVQQDTLEYYATPGHFTRLGARRLSVRNIHDVVDVVQGLLVYDLVAQLLYGVELTPQQVEAIHERDSSLLLALAHTVDPRPLDEARDPAHRLGARCHTFSRLTVALLRAQGVPARARCGFAAYFRPGWFEDHWVAEYWNEADERWHVVDAQLDAAWRRMVGFTGDRFSIADTEFVTAGHAWRAWRQGELDAEKCGLSSIGEHGTFWIAGNLRLDLAALNKVEMLPWDVWGSGWTPGSQPTVAQLELFDGVAELTSDPDARFGELRRRYEADEALRMDGTVFNVLRDRDEVVSSR